jgi:hypothetical protein
MKSILLPAVLAIAFAAAGSAFWTIGHAEQQLADAHRQLAVLQYASASDQSDASVDSPALVQRIGGLGRDDQVDARHLHATADYWETRYNALEPKRDAGGAITETDPDLLLLAANAAFRTTQNDPDRGNTLRRLDGVVKTYAEVLKKDASSMDAAYNYEFVVRTRDALARTKPGTKPPSAAAPKTAAADADLPAGPTLHGRPGGPPAKTDMAQFKIVIPKRGEERKDDPQAGKGNVKVRKG